MHPYPDIPNRNVPTDAAIAATLGISELRLVSDYLRNEDGSRRGLLRANSIWTLKVEPTFYHTWVVGICSAEGREFRTKSVPGWIRGFVAFGDRVIVKELEADPLLSTITQIPLAVAERIVCLDGVGHELKIQSGGLECLLKFAYAPTEVLGSVVRICNEVANSIAKQTGHESLTELIDATRRAKYEEWCRTKRIVVLDATRSDVEFL
ncbi:MAG: hypothetical protein SGJ20_12315 [Planctomycetota bacterium]|nr:hypothetical protein [Planctomycetota bacterium]